MSDGRFEQLLRDLCVLARIADPAPVLQTRTLLVNDVAFTIHERDAEPDGRTDALTIYCDFGIVPAQREAVVLRRLLEVNLFLADAPLAASFIINPETEHVVLGFRAELGKITAELLVQTLESCAQEAERWRKGYFLDSDSAGPVMPRAAAALGAKPRR
jgi:hypothetical protein